MRCFPRENEANVIIMLVQLATCPSCNFVGEATSIQWLNSLHIIWNVDLLCTFMHMNLISTKHMTAHTYMLCTACKVVHVKL